MQYELRQAGPWSYYSFSELEDAGIAAGFMTRSSEAILTDNGRKKEFVTGLSATRMIVLNQVHGCDMHTIRTGERPTTGDGLLMTEPGVIGVIKTADCFPVILYALDGRACAIVHAGWRGTAGRIAAFAVRAMAGLGVAPDRIGALIGPGIGPCCYNIGEDVAAAFRKAGFGDEVFEKRDSSTFLDLRRANRGLLAREGVARIDDVDFCTSCRRDLFFSARRAAAHPAGESARGRQVNFALVKNASAASRRGRTAGGAKK